MNKPVTTYMQKHPNTVRSTVQVLTGRVSRYISRMVDHKHLDRSVTDSERSTHMKRN